MRYRVLATDYDATLATDGRVEPETLAALEALRAAGVLLVLVTGRRLDDLATVFPRGDLFDALVGENGALLRHGAVERLLGAPPPAAFPEELAARRIPFVAGRVVVATWEPHGAAFRRVVDELAVPVELVLNKEATMALPPGVDKASGLAAALDVLGAPPEATVAVGDAENDVVMLRRAGCGVAVANALPEVVAAADLVTTAARGAGIAELARRLIAGRLPPPRGPGPGGGPFSP